MLSCNNTSVYRLKNEMPNQMKQITVYCLPFAGGSKYSYRGYVKSAPPFLNIVPLEIPGRGARSNEKAMTRLELVAEDIFNQIKNDLDKPYAITVIAWVVFWGT